MTDTNADYKDFGRGAGATDASVVHQKSESIHLEAPGTGVADTWRAMGPGVAAAMTGIGASHIIHGPTAGATYGYAFLWIIPVAYLLKYACFEFAQRYTMVKGESVMEAYGRVGRWPFWYLGFQSLANTLGIAGRALGCGAMLYAAFPFIPLEYWALFILVFSVGILWLGQYDALEKVVKLAIIIFALSTFFAFALQSPPPGDYLGRLMPSLAPAGAMILFGAMFGYFPTTTEVSPMQSNWAVDKQSGMVKVRKLREAGHTVTMDKNYMKNSMLLFKRDMNISYIVSMVTGMIFLIIGAAVLNPIGLVPKGSEMGATIAKIYTDTFGAWIFPFIIAGGIAALFSTVFTYFDGQARVFEECAVRLRKNLDTPEKRKMLYRGFQVLWVVTGALIIFGLPRPVLVVQIASVLALLFSPVIYWLNIRAIKDNFNDEFERSFLPGPILMGLAWVGTVGMAVISLYVLTMMVVG
ncbi:Nramp family divalent metal transporter [Paracoccus sp. TK19116]|uniref:Nramp family divalent metal transporter n=1 Tax=Paracoccus albicereus TaxID=2922394 RepID=A0ABT1MTL3_9RHOB|nr:Nramp family divalent metal transporter [Paracoccus albicereus]MCQ0971645.1 Nramp family divalent metal transporter [Paracoccus albicereus]